MQMYAERLDAIIGLVDEVLAACAAYRIPVPELLPFWCYCARRETRLFLWGPPGAGVDYLFTYLSGANISEEGLRGRVVEAAPNTVPGWLYADGTWEVCAPRRPAVQLISGREFAGARVSAQIDGVGIADKPSILTSDRWLHRVALVLILTPATAVLGNREVRLLERLKAAGYRTGLMITGLEGTDQADVASFRREIEDLKLRPLQEVIGPLAVWFVGDLKRGFPDKQALQEWVLKQASEARNDALRKAVDRSFEELLPILEGRGAAGRRCQDRCRFLAEHGEDQVGRLEDQLSGERKGTEHRIRAAFGALREAVEDGELEAVETRSPALIAALDQLETYEVRMRARFQKEIDEFCAAYPDLLAPLPIDWPNSESPLPSTRWSRADLLQALEEVGRSTSRNRDGFLGRLIRGKRKEKECAVDQRLQILNGLLDPVVESALESFEGTLAPAVEAAGREVLEAFRSSLEMAVKSSGEGALEAQAAAALGQLHQRWRRLCGE